MSAPLLASRFRSAQSVRTSRAYEWNPTMIVVDVLRKRNAHETVSRLPRMRRLRVSKHKREVNADYCYGTWSECCLPGNPSPLLANTSTTRASSVIPTCGAFAHAPHRRSNYHRDPRRASEGEEVLHHGSVREPTSRSTHRPGGGTITTPEETTFTT